jgi:NAD(P)-dependent dehydrogenase (short-subunit alcohol dehydrogenase family)
MAIGPDTIRLDGKIAIVTGAAAGLGLAIAETFTALGAEVATCDRNPGTMATFDVRDGDAVRAFVGGLERVDILVNNAGGTFRADFMDVSDNGQRALIDENFTSVTNFIRAVVPKMPPGGAIVNITSIEAHRAGPQFAVYSAMKAAVASLTKSLALEFAERGIRVNCIAPDVVATPGIGLFPASGAGGPGKWPGEPDDVAGVAVFLATDLSRFVTGTSIHVDGGNWAGGGWRAVGGSPAVPRSIL